MANPKIINSKAQKVSEVQEKIQKAKSVVVFDYRGLTVEEVTALRVKMREAGIDYEVIKNNIVERAAEAAGIDCSFAEYLKGPSAFAFGYEDAAAPAKILKKTATALNKCAIKCGIVEGEVISAEDMNVLADLPSREELIARLLGCMMSPVSKFASVLDQIAKKGEEAAPAAE